jgi:hypothetical protein
MAKLARMELDVQVRLVRALVRERQVARRLSLASASPAGV